MKSFRIMLLIGCLFALLTSGIAQQHSWRKLLSPFAAFAQDLPAKEGSAFQNQQRTKTNEDDQDVPLGQTAISVSVDLVSLQVLVTDKKGNVVTGLKPENFTIYEDNVKQEISNFSPVEANITAVMLVEYSRQISYFIYEVFNAMYYFARNIRQGDWIAVVGYDIEPKILCDF